MRSVLGLAVAVVLGSWSLAAAAEPVHGKHVVLIPIPIIQVNGRVQTPLASVEVNRAEPKLTLNELRPSFTGRISASLGRE